MSNKQQISTTKTPTGWRIELDNATWAEMMTAISIAIDTCERGDQERATRLKALRSALSHADKLEP